MFSLRVEAVRDCCEVARRAFWWILAHLDLGVPISAGLLTSTTMVF
jgi:hypothetical protein